MNTSAFLLSFDKECPVDNLDSMQSMIPRVAIVHVSTIYIYIYIYSLCPVADHNHDHQNML